MSPPSAADDDSLRIIYNRDVIATEDSEPRTGQTNSRRRRLMTFLKISVTVAGLILALRSLDFRTILTLFTSAISTGDGWQSAPC